MNKYNCSLVKREKRRLRRISNVFGLCFMAVFAMQLIFMRFLGNGIFLNKTTGIVINFFCWLIPYTVMLGLFHKNFIDTLSLKKPNNYGISYFFIGLTCSYLAAQIASLIVDLLTHVGIKSVTPKSLLEYENTPAGILMFIIEVAVFPAIVEELIFRGALFGCLREYGEIFAMVASAAIFGLFHGNIEQLIFAFLLGLVLAFVVIKTNSLFIAVLIHFVNNFKSCIIKVLSDNNPLWSQLSVIVGVIILAVIVIPGLIAYFKLRKNNIQAVSVSGLNKNSSLLTLSERVKCFIFNPGMIIWILYFIYSIVLSVKEGANL